MERFRRYRELLEAKRLELERKQKVEGLDEVTPSHDAGDVAAANGHKEMVAMFQNMRTNLLHFVNLALDRIADDTYATCFHCEEPISEKRLNAVPEALLCIQCQEALDRGQLEAPELGALSA
ncbi:MAG: TraR/DksA C4-type zinc finger protein [Patescibacteria group bacterium]|nr:TraR/DksA C4-type zinc finger protein [Patescibacteria group bacterium]